MLDDMRQVLVFPVRYLRKCGVLLGTCVLWADLAVDLRPYFLKDDALESCCDQTRKVNVSRRFGTPTWKSGLSRKPRSRGSISSRGYVSSGAPPHDDRKIGTSRVAELKVGVYTQAQRGALGAQERPGIQRCVSFLVLAAVFSSLYHSSAAAECVETHITVHTHVPKTMTT